MTIATATTRPPRCVLANVETGESLECLFNPKDLTEKIEVNWTRLGVLGLSHQVLQFQNTGNRQFPGVEFYVDRFFAEESGFDGDILDFRNFLCSLTVPLARTEGVAATRPPRVLLIWPEVITVECVLASVEFQYRQLAVDGTVLVYAATVNFEEVLDTRITSEERREGR